MVFGLCSLLTWLIKPYPTELLSGSSSTDLVKALLGAPKRRKSTETALRV